MSSTPSLDRLESLSLRGMKLGLAAIDALCERLGRPERTVPPVLIAGTNGKGSTAATLSAIARAAGVRAGLYTSPHLIAVTERIRLEECDVAPAELDAALACVFEAADAPPAIPVTYFEAITAAAFHLFRGRRLDLAVLEVGLGGRYDATNVAPARASLVTAISRDHVEELGPTVDAIAREKAGVFRPGRPALAWTEDAQVRTALEACAAAVGAPFHDVARQTRLEIGPARLDGLSFGLETPQASYHLETPLPGRHQAWNTALAVRAVELLAGDYPSFGAAAIVSGVAAVRWPGRLELRTTAGKTVLLDGCHNPEGAARLAAFLEETGTRGDLLFGAMADKEIEAMGAALFPRVRSVTFVAPATGRAATPRELSERAGPLAREVRPGGTVEEALRRLFDRRETETIIVAGSLHLVGEARALLLAGRFEEDQA